MVPGTGVEPARPCEHQVLNLARLPIPPPGQAGGDYGGPLGPSIRSGARGVVQGSDLVRKPLPVGVALRDLGFHAAALIGEFA
jgi:hypothetical protein